MIPWVAITGYIFGGFIKVTDIQDQVLYTAAAVEQFFTSIDADWPLVADVETFGTDPANGKLLGLALCSVASPLKPVYIALQWYEFNTSTWRVNNEFELIITSIKAHLSYCELVGHNYAYDKLWLDTVLKIETSWHACTRLMWHMASAPSGPKGYGLKDAQIEVLGWDKRGSDELEAQVQARGGKLKEGGHYLADVGVLGHYACLDGSSTAMLYNELKRFFDLYDYWWMLEKMVAYSWLLQVNTTVGIRVDLDRLEKTIETLQDTKAAYGAAFQELASSHITRLERIWRDDRAAKYTLPAAKERFLSDWSMQKKFNLSSDKDKRELFYTSMGLPVVVETDGGKGSTSLDGLRLAIRDSHKEDLKELLEIYEEAESCDTLLSSFAKPWLAASTSGRLNPRFNPCGTVSYRLSGFKPYLLNAPFSEYELMSCLTCDEGWVGLHADFVSVEPAVTAHYSQDPSLLKVFRDGLGDVYLDLALTLFPRDEALKAEYNPYLPVTSAVKSEFKKVRDIGKLIHLAVQYTGKEYTVQKNLDYAGYPTTLEEARTMVADYWKHFHKVAVMNETLFRMFGRKGYLRNAVGRVIRVPTHVDIPMRDGTIWHKEIPRFKDLPSRFIQSSAHDILSFWVLIIARKVKEQGLKAKPVIIDCHDSTSWQAPQDEINALEVIFKEALTELNQGIRLSVPVKVEMKRFHTLAGLKGQEDL